MRADRRNFLGWFSAAGVAIGGGIALVRGGNYSIPSDVGPRLVTLRPWQWAVFQALGARVLAPESADVGLFADVYLAGLAQRDRDDLLGLLGYVEHIAPLLAGCGPRFTQLVASDQDRVLERLEQHPVGLLRGGFQALKAISMLAHYRKDSAFAALGYSGPAVKWSPR
ncbi:MAG: hypothetical protein IPI67_26380 [Myxococcales bacterium]|nr:hypothetical protein [Myxococcales bacterium]